LRLGPLSPTAHDTTHQLESTEPVVVFDNDDHCGEQAWPSVESFIATFKKPLVQPILPSTPRLCTTKAARVEEDDDWIPKRSARLAAKSKFRVTEPPNYMKLSEKIHLLGQRI
jgi:hypothetical protein